VPDRCPRSDLLAWIAERVVVDKNDDGVDRLERVLATNVERKRVLGLVGVEQRIVADDFDAAFVECRGDIGACVPEISETLALYVSPRSSTTGAARLLDADGAVPISAAVPPVSPTPSALPAPSAAIPSPECSPSSHRS